MSASAIELVTQAMRGMIRARLATTDEDTPIFIGSPSQRSSNGNALISLFLFHLEPNHEMRNTERVVETAGATDFIPHDALPVDLRYMISFFRPAPTPDAAAADTNDLLRLGHVIAALHETSTIGEALVPGQSVRITPEPYPMEEISRVWGLFNNESYVTSIIYLASPVFIDARESVRGDPVVSRRLDSGHAAGAPDVFGRGDSALSEVAP